MIRTTGVDTIADGLCSWQRGFQGARRKLRNYLVPRCLVEHAEVRVRRVRGSGQRPADSYSRLAPLSSNAEQTNGQHTLARFRRLAHTLPVFEVWADCRLDPC